MSSLVYQGFRLGLGILYPAYSSFKAVRSKNVKEYVKWMMYWIVFALFSFLETFADFILIWFPFYYELKIFFILWLVSPVTKGSSVLYRKLVHPQLLKREKEIDANISKATDQGYATLITLGSRGFNLATNIVLSTAIRGSSRLSDQLQKSLSLNDLSRDKVDYLPVRRLETKLSFDEDELDNQMLSERYHLEMAENASLEEIDREVNNLPVLEPSDAVRIRRRRKIESTLREVMSDSSPTLAQSLVGSVRLPRKYRPVEQAAIPESLNETDADSVLRQQLTPISSSAGTSAASVVHYFRSPEPHPSSATTTAGPSPPLPPSPPPSPPPPAAQPSNSASTDSAVSSQDHAVSSTSTGTLLSRRLKFSFFSSHSSSKPKS